MRGLRFVMRGPRAGGRGASPGGHFESERPLQKRFSARGRPSEGPKALARFHTVNYYQNSFT